MKLFSTCILVAIVAQIYGTPQFNPKLDYYREGTDVPCVKTCSDDCLSLIICYNDKPLEVNCRKQNPDKPFCNKDTLQCDASSDHCTATEGGPCDLEPGYYPNLMDCKSYYYCDKPKQIPDTCVGSTKYNPKTERCETGASCYDFTNTGLCKGKEDTLIVHPLVKYFSVFCAAGQEPILIPCVTKDYEFDPKLTGCKYVCKEAGRFPDCLKQDCTHYYECVKSGTGYLQQHKACPTGTLFDGTSCRTGATCSAEDQKKLCKY